MIVNHMLFPQVKSLLKVIADRKLEKSLIMCFLSGTLPSDGDSRLERSPEKSCDQWDRSILSPAGGKWVRNRRQKSFPGMAVS